MEYKELINMFSIVNIAFLGILVIVAIILLKVAIEGDILSNIFRIICAMTGSILLIIFAVSIYDIKHVVSYEVREEIITLDDIHVQTALIDERFVTLIRTDDTRYDNTKKLDKPVAKIDVVTFKVKDRFYIDKDYAKRELKNPRYVVKKIEY